MSLLFCHFTVSYIIAQDSSHDFCNLKLNSPRRGFYCCQNSTTVMCCSGVFSFCCCCCFFLIFADKLNFGLEIRTQKQGTWTCQRNLAETSWKKISYLTLYGPLIILLILEIPNLFRNSVTSHSLVHPNTWSMGQN